VTNPTIKTVDDTLREIEAAERDPAHPRSLARQAVKRWRSDAERLKLPVANVHDSKGAEVLDIDAALAYHDHDRRLGRQ
jgi:hypothetical protein